MAAKKKARVLRESTVVGGVVYAAGTKESDIDGDVSADVWETSEGSTADDGE